jgi:hypothetical protein
MVGNGEHRKQKHKSGLQWISKWAVKWAVGIKQQKEK